MVGGASYTSREASPRTPVQPLTLGVQERAQSSAQTFTSRVSAGQEHSNETDTALFDDRTRWDEMSNCFFLLFLPFPPLLLFFFLFFLLFFLPSFPFPVFHVFGISGRERSYHGACQNQEGKTLPGARRGPWEGSACRLLVSSETAQFLNALASAKARDSPLILKGRIHAALVRRWSAMLGCTAARSHAVSLLDKVASGANGPSPGAQG